jgi:hypothetical protein
MDMLIEGEVAPNDCHRPARWEKGSLELALSYRFDPGSAADGVTVHIPLALLGAVRETNFEWLVPAFRQELVIALLRALPKPLRTPLVPIPDTAAALLASVKPRSGPLLAALAEAIERLRGVRIGPGNLSLDDLPPHLRMTFSVEDEDGTVLASGQSLDALRDELRPRLRARLERAAPALARHGMLSFDVESLPRTVDLPGGLRGFPALVDEGDTVGIRICDSAPEQAVTMARGTRRLLHLTVLSPRHWVTGQLGPQLTLALAAGPHGTLEAAIDDATSAALNALIASGGGPAWDAEAFTALREHVRGNLRPTTLDALVGLGQILEAARAVRERLDMLPATALLGPAREDVARQLGRLVYPGMLTGTGLARLGDVERYLRAAAQRLERLPSRVAADRERMATIHMSWRPMSADAPTGGGSSRRCASPNSRRASTSARGRRSSASVRPSLRARKLPVAPQAGAADGRSGRTSAPNGRSTPRPSSVSATSSTPFRIILYYRAEIAPDGTEWRTRRRCDLVEGRQERHPRAPQSSARLARARSLSPPDRRGLGGALRRRSARRDSRSVAAKGAIALPLSHSRTAAGGTSARPSKQEPPRPDRVPTPSLESALLATVQVLG